ncbi:cytochrome b [Mesorhizobium sp. RCC_202]|uniref:cytochrome b n=1 Tax=Mesorhizobium sp. RCC_202 TaxID=3239222 RepID=UPI0035252666
MTDTRVGYSTYQIALHWIIAALVLFQLLFGESMKMVVDAAENGQQLSATDQTMGSAHYWVGIAILALVVLRLALRLATGAAAPASESPKWMHLAAKASHALFYVLLLATPVLGLLAFYVGDPWGDIHSLSKPAFIVLIAVHALAAFYHQFWLRDGTLRRMLSPAR